MSNCFDLCSVSLPLARLGFSGGEPQAQFIPYKFPAVPFPCLRARPRKKELIPQTFPKQLQMWEDLWELNQAKISGCLCSTERIEELLLRSKHQFVGAALSQSKSPTKQP